MAALPIASFTPRRKWQIAFHVGLSTLALLAIIFCLNVVAARHFFRWQWSKQTRLQLSPMTLNLLKNITNDIQVIVYFDQREALYGPVSQMIKAYQAVCPKLQVETVDYVYFLGRATAVQNEFKLNPPEKDRILFHGNGQTSIVNASELSDYEYSGLLTGKEIKRTNFKGEQLFTAALYRILNPRAATAYFLEGHGENDPSEGDNWEGFRNFAKMIQASSIRVQTLTLATNEIPADCQLLIIAAPAHRIATEELAKIEKYLSQGGRLLVLFSYNSSSIQTGLEGVLAGYGIQVGHNSIVDPEQAQSGDSRILMVSSFGSHEIVRPLLRSRLRIVVPRTIGKSNPSGTGEPVKVTELAFSSPTSTSVVLNKSGEPVPERQGALPLIVAAEKGGIQGVSADVGATRIVAVGDSLCFGNTLLDLEANRDFALSAVNWLLNRDVLLQGIGPSPVVEYRVTMTKSQMNNLRWLLLGILPGGTVSLGVLIWLRRRA